MSGIGPIAGSSTFTGPVATPWAHLAASANQSYQATNRSHLQAVTVPGIITVTAVRFYVVGQSGNLDFGVYNDAGVLLGSTGSFACPAVGLQSRSFTAPIVLVPGRKYWIATSNDTSSAMILTYMGPDLANLGTLGLATIVSANFPLANCAISTTAPQILQQIFLT